LTGNINNIAQNQTGYGVVTYECPYCGGPLHFGDANMTNCEHCGREVQKIPPPIKLTNSIDSENDEREKKGDEDFARTGGVRPMFFPFYYVFFTHSYYSSSYSGVSPTHPAHFHGVGGFAG